VRARDLRDDVALAVLPVLVAQCAVTPGELNRQSIVQQAYAWADDVMYQRARDIEEPESVMPEDGTCVSGFRRHKWINHRCVRCGRLPDSSKRPHNPIRRIALVRKEA
jgi:hypothetical protein